MTAFLCRVSSYVMIALRDLFFVMNHEDRGVSIARYGSCVRIGLRQPTLGYRVLVPRVQNFCSLAQGPTDANATADS